MTAQLRAVVRTYATRRLAWALAGLGVIYALNLLGARSSSPERLGPSSQFVIGFPAGLIAYFLASQSKWQFVNPRARMLPGFAAVHLAVLALFALVGFGALPAVTAAVTGMNALGAAACTIAMAATFTWALHATRALPNLLALAIFFSLLSEVGVSFWLLPASAERFFAIHAAIFLAGWSLEIAWIIRLAGLHEEHDDYNIPVSAQSGSATRMERDLANRNMSRQLLRSGFTRITVDLWHDRLQGVRATTARARQRLLRYGFVAQPVVVSAVFMAAIFTAILVFSANILQSSGPETIVLASLNVMVIMPAILPANTLPMRRARMSQELLWPLDRRHYIDGLLGAVAGQSAVMWVVMQLAMLGVIALRSPQLLTMEFVLAFTALTLSVQVYAFGFTCWVARRHSAVWRLAMMMVIIIPGSIGAVAGMNALQPEPTPEPLHPAVYESLEQELPPEERSRIERHIEQHERRVRVAGETHPLGAWLASGVLTGIGVIGIVLGRRRWMETELG